MPTVTLVAGVPEICGALFAGTTEIEKAGNAALAAPSDTEIVMPG